ncbi:MAG: adenosylcobinamide kinase / adenosylcobinamide-phosphate guanylyltransferase [Gaiellaceae bacterium]|nr:adenosylcobinamide kinase / adenosylcobinamide-phosphate guanylyltransferase [Gaiellaceae bacterium]
MPLVLLIGGARSGKSQLAVRLAAEQGSPVVFLATAQAGDQEMAERIARHRDERSTSWQTIEEPLRLAETIAAVATGACLVIDCLTLWTANALEALGTEATQKEAPAAASLAAARSGLTVAISNEVGLGIVPDNPLARGYRDLLGRVNTRWADAADRVLLLVAARALVLDAPDSLLEGLR